MGSIALLGQVSVWLTPFWLISVGVTLGVVVLALLLGVTRLFSAQTANTALTTISEGVLRPISFVALGMALFALAASTMMPVGQAWTSFQRFTVVGETKIPVEVPKETRDYPVDVEFRSSELSRFEFASDQDVFISAKKEAAGTGDAIGLEGGEAAYVWTLDSGSDQPLLGTVRQLYITNESAAPAKVRLVIETEVTMPQVSIIPKTAAALVLLYLVYFLIQIAFPKIAAIALTTSKEAIAQPLYLIVLGLGAFGLLLFIVLPYYTFGDDVKMLKETGVMTIKTLAILVALWTASVSIADEIEGRTALTLLSKPVGRHQFIFGKFIGILWPTVLMFVALGLWFLLTVSYKVVYDAKESAASAPVWQDCYLEMIGVVPGLLLAWMETVMMIAIGVAISTRLPMLPNLIICFSIFTIGHLGPLIVNSSAGRFEIVSFAGRLVAVVLPMLDYYQVDAAIAQNAPVPLAYLGMSLLYCVLYSTAAMLLALAMFEDRDLA